MLEYMKKMHTAKAVDGEEVFHVSIERGDLWRSAGCDLSSVSSFEI